MLKISLIFGGVVDSLRAMLDMPTPHSPVTLRSVSDEGSWAPVAGMAMVLPEGGAKFLVLSQGQFDGRNIMFSRYFLHRFIVD